MYRPFITNSALSFQNMMIVSTQLSDFHTIVITALKMKYKKNPQEKKNYKSFDRVKFKTELNPELNKNVSNCHSFENTFIEVQNKHTPMEKKILRASHVPFMTK